MTAVILTIHSLIVLALIGVVLLQRSDGGALGLGGGGGGGGGFMSGRGAANALTRTTSILAALFFATSIVLAIRAGGGDNADAIADELTATGEEADGTVGAAPVDPRELSAEDLLNSLDSGTTHDEDDGHGHDDADAAADDAAAVQVDSPVEQVTAAPETAVETGDDEAADDPAETPNE